jgi:superfamily II DNA or RNA helicase
MKRELTAESTVPDYFTGRKGACIVAWQESEKHLCIPKFYGLQKLGRPAADSLDCGQPMADAVRFEGQIRLEQREPIARFLEAARDPLRLGGVLSAATGTGKSLGIDTPVLMYDGCVKMVQDVEVGDFLMGDDSTPRKVLALGRGEDELYDIIPVKGEKYTVNSPHILCLMDVQKENISCMRDGRWRTRRLDNATLKEQSRYFKTKEEALSYLRTFTEENRIAEVSVTDYLKLPKHTRHCLKGYKKGVEFPHKDVDFDPYIIGVWLGDGTSNNTQITNQDARLLLYLRRELKRFNLNLRFQASYQYVVEPDTARKHNAFRDALKRYNLLNNKHIPDDYKINDRKTRLKVLAGLLDTDGYYHNNCYEIIQKNKRLSDDILFLARSLGFAAYQKECQKSCMYKGEKRTGTYYRVYISGAGLEDIPVQITRKQAKPREQKKDALVTGIKVEHRGRGKYYGFVLDGNKRFLLGDFTVTHNTTMAINIMCELRVRTMVVVHKAFLMDQWRERIRQFAPQARIGRIQGSTMDVEGCDVVLAMLQSLCRKVYPPSVTAGFGLMVVDECHHMGAEVFSRALQRVVCRVSLGLSATVERRDGLTKVFLWHLGDVVYHMAGRSDDGSVTVQVRRYLHPRAASIGCPQLHNGKPDLPKMVGAIVEDSGRNDFLCAMLAELGAAGRKTLVLSERRAHLHSLRDRLQRNGADSVGLYYGGLSAAVLKESEACRVVLGTYSMAQEGLDIPGLDSLILATPKGEVTQAVGRILRDRPETRRHSPLVLDVVDSIIFDGFFERQARKRKAMYTRRGFSVHVHREHPTMDP